ncbi:MAG: alpha/beta fold hydrolase [Actinomycetota bacterium]
MRVTVGDKKLYFDVEGEKLCHNGDSLVEKPTLILLHGSPGNSDHTVFKPLFSQLTDVAQIVYLDLSGCGRSDDTSDGVFSLERWADDIVHFCHVVGIDKPVVLGNSAGGMVAAMYGIRHPDHPGGLILSSTQARLQAERCVAVFERLGGAEIAEVALRALKTVGDAASFMEYGARCMAFYNPTPQNRARLITYREKCAEAFHLRGGIWYEMDFLDDLHAISCPTLVLAGEDDPVTPIEDSLDIVDQLCPDIRQFERFANAGHGVWLDQPERAFSVLREFLSQF